MSSGGMASAPPTVSAAPSGLVNLVGAQGSSGQPQARRGGSRIFGTASSPSRWLEYACSHCVPSRPFAKFLYGASTSHGADCTAVAERR
ncbi:unnamed protein product [Ectocarpus sp. CCAP 1310/34]|nr:unnamed protein product [Ectocarpus sp. CCAP 1310/34]